VTSPAAVLSSLPATLFRRLETSEGHAAQLDWPGTFATVDDFHHTTERTYLWAPVTLVDEHDGISNDNVRAVTALVYDFDYATLEQMDALLRAFAAFEYACHSSWRHTPEAPRFRLVLPLAEPASPATFRHLWQQYAEVAITASGAHPDPKCKDPAHRYYWPSAHPERRHLAFAMRNEGALLTPLRPIAATSASTVSPSAPRSTTAPGQQRSGLFSTRAEADRRRSRGFEQDRDVSLIEASCAFLRQARDLAAEQIKEPEWHAALSIWSRCTDGDRLAHERSSPDPRYDRDETQRKIDRIKSQAIEDGIGPATCGYIRSLAAPENRCANACAGCKVGAPTGPIRSPAVLGMRADTATATADAARTRVADLDDAIANTPDPAERKTMREERKEAAKDARSAQQAAARAAVLAPAAATGGRIFARGDHTEVSLALIGDLQNLAGGPSPVSHAGRLYLHDPATGLWTELPEPSLHVRVATYAGTPVAAPKPYELRVNRSDQTGVSAMVASAIRAASPDPLPATEGAAFHDGMLLPDGSFRPFVPGDYVLAEHALDVPYLDPTTATPPPPPRRWLRFLEEIYANEPDTPTRILVLQEFLGAALFGVATRYQRALVLLGETGANGKSVLLTVIGHLFPTLARGAIAPHHLEGTSSEYYRAMLLRLRLNVVSELPENELMDTSTLKAVISGDEVIAREIRESPFRGRPKAAWIIAANALPPVRDTSGGFWRRQLVFTHNVRFDGKGSNPAADPHLADRLLAELPGIAAWAAEGGRRLLAQQGYTTLASSDALVDQWARDNDPIRRFIEEHTTPVSNQDEILLPAARLYTAYRSWAQDNGNSTTSSARFYRRLPGLGLRPRHTKAGNVYPCRIVNLPGHVAPTGPVKKQPVAEA